MRFLLNLLPSPIWNILSKLLNISSNDNIDNIEIFNLLGSMIYSGSNINAKSTSIKTDVFKQGYYFIRVSTNDGRTYSNKFIVR